MLMLAIISWNKDLTIQHCESMQRIKDLRNRFNNPNISFVLHDSNHLCPIKLDNATRQLAEDEIIEWKAREVYPALLDEGKMEYVNGKLKFKKARKLSNVKT